VEGLELRDGDEDDDSLLSALDVDLLGGGDLEHSKLRLELGNVVLEVEDGLGDLLLDLVRSGGGSVGGPLDLGSERHNGDRATGGDTAKAGTVMGQAG
jgi:hypothetical protein